jgi:NitT/TauT family transport system permease protein
MPSSSLAIVVAILSGFLGSEHGLGYLIIISSVHLESRLCSRRSELRLQSALPCSIFLEFVERRVVFWTAAELE